MFIIRRRKTRGLRLKNFSRTGEARKVWIVAEPVRVRGCRERGKLDPWPNESNPTPATSLASRLRPVAASR